MPATEYFALDALSSSIMGELKKSAKHALEAIRRNKHEKTKKHYRIGRAGHVYILEPDKFDAQYSICDLDARTKSGKALLLEIQQAGKEVLSSDDMYSLDGCRKAIIDDEYASALLKTATHKELTLTYEEDGLLYKARLDAVTPIVKNQLTILDLKLVRNAHISKFPGVVYDHGYHRQSAWYTDLLKRNIAGFGSGLSAGKFIFIAVEKEAPYCLGVYEIGRAHV